ncbi:XdhC family protein [Micromonospora sp. CA-240977]|uniref:XdhC family protein n=1 Tax=Micromonospora sp. CA-240977 TaxID=3239957 RepID=UPI003D8AE5F4
MPVLALALRHPLAYVGAMGSRRTHDERRKRLREAGVSATQLARLAAPIGLDLGGPTPEETAVSVAAQIVAGRWGGTGRPRVIVAQYCKGHVVRGLRRFVEASGRQPEAGRPVLEVAYRTLRPLW